ncbi:sarcosine oxidase subunit delta [Sphingobium sp. JAI105]|uniref:sarcosine oxidase subunit delta n=1 Tax=Sphingobium sp. JAI105 TaxID=2787715 RepID=UPI0018CBF08F|nr:sarcosine oxidase subunit delta [Sphingobium sp. JAI105]MBG6118464.1 sarcosine oxidase subunit delta [Sphingobium sp. JAI105]
MRIPCPYCGERDSLEFSYKSDAAPKRPIDSASVETFVDYVYFRNNPAGVIREHWYHANGCRNWIILERDTISHQIFGASIAKGASQ